MLAWQVDPLNHFRPQGVKPEALVKACGVLLEWVDDSDRRPAREQYDHHYNYGPLHESTGGSITEEGIFMYPQDPPQYPMVKGRMRHETIYIYQHAFVAIVNDNGNIFRTRID